MSSVRMVNILDKLRCDSCDSCKSVFQLWLKICLLSFCFCSILPNHVYCDNSFNYDVGIRVHDKVSDYLQMISAAGSLPVYIVKQKLVNISRPSEACPHLFYPSLEQYTNLISKLYIGLETAIVPKCSPGKCIRSRYDINSENGLPLPNANFNSSYDGRARPWYIQVKRTLSPSWTPPYLDATSGYPVITFATPVINQSIDNVRFRFTGVIGADIFLTDISNFLVKSFQNTDRKVFIIDALTGYLAGNSFGARTSITTTSDIAFVMAKDSPDPIISGATRLLMEQNFPPRLILFKQYYLQSVIYTDPFPGLMWYIVILMPTTPDVDHLGPDSSFYVAALILSSFAACTSAIVLCLTLFYWKQKIVKLSQPRLLLGNICGNIVLVVMSFFLIGENTGVSCAIRPYLFCLGFTLSFAPLLFKSMKAMFVLGGEEITRKSFKDHWFLLLLIFFIAIDLLLLTTTLYMGNAGGTSPITETILTSNGAYAAMTYCGYHHNTPLASVIIAYKCLVITLACYTSFKARNMPDAIGGSKVLMVVVYVTAFLVTIVAVIVTSVKDVAGGIFTEVLGVTVYVMITAILLTGPWLFMVLFIGDSQSVDAVLTDLQESRKLHTIAVNISNSSRKEPFISTASGREPRQLHIDDSLERGNASGGVSRLEEIIEISSRVDEIIEISSRAEDL